MAEKRVGVITSWKDLSAGLSIFTLKPREGTSFPDYKAGQYIALTREGCKLTVKVKEADGRIHYPPATNEDGTPKIGPVTHSYSIASAPFETKMDGELAIYITLEKLSDGRLGRLTESLFAGPHAGDSLGYVDRIVGNFTLDQRAAGSAHVVMVGTGTGLAPFIGMMKQVAYEAEHGQPKAVKYTLIHANRTAAELAYDAELRELNRRSKTLLGFAFQYVPSVSRPTPADEGDRELSQGRANNLFRAILGLPTRENEVVLELRASGSADLAAAEKAAAKCTEPKLAPLLDAGALRELMPRDQAVVLTCGNAEGMEDIRRIADKANFKFEMEEW